MSKSNNNILKSGNLFLELKPPWILKLPRVNWAEAKSFLSHWSKSLVLCKSMVLIFRVWELLKQNITKYIKWLSQKEFMNSSDLSDIKFGLVLIVILSY